MAGSISLSLTQQFDLSGNLLAGGQVFFIQAGTVATPQNAYQDLGLTLPWPNPYTLLTNGRIPQVYFADGYIKVRMVDQDGVQVFNQDNIPVTGPSSGGGGGGGVDPTTIIQTGDVKARYGVGVLDGFVRCNRRTIGSATSGATERANADTQALFVYLYNANPNLVVSGGRGASAAADYAANKTIELPDFRGRIPGGLDGMGNSLAGRLSASYFGSAADDLGISGGLESNTLVTANLPPYTPAGSVSASGTISTLVASVIAQGTSGGVQVAQPPGAVNNQGAFSAVVGVTGTFTGTAAPGQNSAPIRTVQPTILLTYYVKL